MKITKIKIKIGGLADIMFDKFFDHSKEKRPPEQKLYLADKNKVVLPAENIRYFLFANKPPGCAKTYEGRASKEYITWGLGHVFIDPQLIPFLDEKDEEILFTGFENENTKFYVYSSSPRDAHGNKMEVTHRPVLKLPWILAFEITVVENPRINSAKLQNWFNMGGLQLAIGNYRPLFGRFYVISWEAEEIEQ